MLLHLVTVSHLWKWLFSCQAFIIEPDVHHDVPSLWWSQKLYSSCSKELRQPVFKKVFDSKTSVTQSVQKTRQSMFKDSLKPELVRTCCVQKARLLVFERPLTSRRVGDQKFQELQGLCSRSVWLKNVSDAKRSKANTCWLIRSLKKTHSFQEVFDGKRSVQCALK